MFLSLEHEGLIHNIRMIMNYQISSHLDFASPRAKHVAKLTEGSANEQVKLSKKTNQVGFKYMFLKTKQSKNGPIQSKSSPTLTLILIPLSCLLITLTL